MQSKPETVKILKGLGLKYHIDSSRKEHDGIVCNHDKYVFSVPSEINKLMLDYGLNNGLNYEFLSLLTKKQLKILYNSMMLGDGIGQNRLIGNWFLSCQK